MRETVETLKARYPQAETFSFGDSDALSDRLIHLVRTGKKTATTGAYRDFEMGEPLPEIGRRDIVLSWNGAPALVIETVEIRRCSFMQITEEMALAEGEGEDESLDGWRKGHREFFERNGGFAPDMEVLWERFILVEECR